MGCVCVKYMGSKRWMLQNGLGDAILNRISQHDRFVDLFSGSAAVSWHVASTYCTPVLANDLQEFCRALADAVLCRTRKLGHHWIDTWIARATSEAQAHPLYSAAKRLDSRSEEAPISDLSADARALCSKAGTPITAAYGGHYFSPLQAIQLDSLRVCLPPRRPHHHAGLAAVIQTASACAASPGHTAQPFKPTTSAGPFLLHSWSRDVIKRTRVHAGLLSEIGSKQPGVAVTGDANHLASRLGEGDLVFIDPPYSSVHYSRFYHVLETVAHGKPVDVAGVGRYPPRALRPSSSYSLPSESEHAFRELLQIIGARRCGAIVTFPAGLASNGLSGTKVIDLAREWFSVDYVKVKSRFSTLGGNSRNRSARMRSEELLLSLHPKSGASRR